MPGRSGSSAAMHSVHLEGNRVNALRFALSHTWVRVEANGWLTLGVTRLAVIQLGELVFIDLPEVGKELRRGEVGIVIESVRNVCDLLMPVSGSVVAANTAAADEPVLVGRDPQGSGWLIRMRARKPNELELLMDEDSYESLTRRAGQTGFARKARDTNER